MSESDKNDATQEQKQKAEQIKSRIDSLRKEWDRLDAHGSQSEKQGSITGAIESLQEQLKNLTGETH